VNDDRAGGGEERSAEAPASARYGHVVEGVSALVAPATLLTGIAFYFGWQRVKSFDEYFGLNPSAVGYSTRDYVLNSLDALFLPIIVVLLVLMALSFAHAYLGRVHRAGARPETLHRLSRLGLVGGAVLLLVGGLGAFGVFPFHTPYLVATLLPAAGVLLIAWAIDLRARLRGDPPLSVGGRVLVGLFAAVCLFWAAGLYAETVGRNQAARLARHLAELPGVTVSSTSDLAFPLRLREPAGTGSGSHTYGPLRLLAQENDKLFLLPADWTAKHGRLYVVPETDATEMAFTPATVHGSTSLVAGGVNNESAVSSTYSTPAYLEPVSRKVGPLVVKVVNQAGLSAVSLVNRTSRPVSGVSAALALPKGAAPHFSGGPASCRVTVTGLACKVDAIPPGHRRVLRIAYPNRSMRGLLTVKTAAGRGTLRLKLG
jgi:hypothetical protein